MVAAPILPGEPPSTFQSLLRQLENEHHRQVNLLRTESERHFTELKGTPRACRASDWLDAQPCSAQSTLCEDWLSGPSAKVPADSVLALRAPQSAFSVAPAAPLAVPAAGSGIGASSALEHHTLPTSRVDDPITALMSASVAAAPVLGPQPDQGESALETHAAIAERNGHSSQANWPSERMSASDGDDPPVQRRSPAEALARVQQSLQLRSAKTSRPYFTQREVWASDYMESHELSFKHTWSPHESPAECHNAAARYSISPNSSAKLIWDVTGMTLLLWDMIAIPFTLAFDPDEGWFLKFMGWATLIFWTIDMGLACNTAYFDDGHLITSPQKIFWHYLTSWFVLDCCIVGLDWFMTIASLLGGEQSKGGGSIVGIGRMLRGLRVMRVLRLLRLAKLKEVAHKLYDLIDTEYTFLVIKLVRLMTTILFINHFVSCLWFSVGRAGSDEEPHWLDKLTFAPGEPRSAERLLWQYSTSLHWSLSQFTPAGMEIVSVNTQERVFSCVTVFFAMGIFTSVVANVSASMTALRSLNDETAKQFWLLRRYLQQNDIGAETRSRILRYLEHQVHQDFHKVKPPQILAMLSEPLREMLAGALVERQMTHHPFFLQLKNDAVRVMHLLCHQAFATKAFAEDDIIFSAGHVGEFMFIFFFND